MVTEVTLNWGQVRQGAFLGVERCIRMKERGLHSWKFPSKTIYDYDIEGACAEIAVAQYLGTNFPATIDNYKEPDLDTFIEVRLAVVKPGNDISKPHLFYRKKDTISRAYVLVVGCSPVFYIAGWIWGKAAVLAVSPDRDGTRWIRQSDLSPEEELKNHIGQIEKFKGLRGIPYHVK